MMINLHKSDSAPSWIKNFRIKTLKELRNEFRKKEDLLTDDFSWRERVPLHYCYNMDTYCGLSLTKLKIITVLSDTDFYKANKGNLTLIIKDFNGYDTWEISKAMLKPILRSKIKRLLEI